MERLFIHRNGHITQNGEKVTRSVLKSLGNSIDVDKRFTLGSFFSMIHQYPDLKNTNEVLGSLLDIVRECGEPVIKTDEIDSLIFYKTIEIRGFPGTPSLNFYNTLKGISNKKVKDLKFFHLETLLNHQLKLGKLNHIIFGDTEDLFQYDTFYTLFELVEGISWELSFNFNPLQCSIRR